MKRVIGVVVGVAASASLVACGGATKVGNSTLLTIPEKSGKGFDPTATTIAGNGTLPPVSTTQAARTTVPQTAPPRTTSTLSPQQQQAITAVIHISGASTSAFDPSLQAVYPGTPVQWVNTDTVVRSVVSDDGGSFSSGPIAPGKSYTWKTTGAPRRINYHDGTRPYAVGALQVVKAP